MWDSQSNWDNSSVVTTNILIMNSAIAAMLSNNSIDYVSCSEYFCLGKYLWLLEWFEKIIDFIQVVMRITNAKEVVNLY